MVTITEATTKDIAAIACVEKGGRWLLGLSRSKDTRLGTWCFPGGHIKPGELPTEAAERECKEETGVSVKSIGLSTRLPDKPGIVFLKCKPAGPARFKPNEEFSAVGFFSRKEMKKLNTYSNVLAVIELLG